MSERAFIPIGIAVMTISDTRSQADDKSGDTLAERIKTAGHRLAGRVIIKDDVRQIRASARKFLADKNVDVVISTGGTGLTGRDVTIEALRPLFEKGDRRLRHGVPHDLLPEGQHLHDAKPRHGWRGQRQIHFLPAGLPGACRDGWDEILIHQLDYRHKPCNFVEIMPRLEEGLRRK